MPGELEPVLTVVLHCVHQWTECRAELGHRLREQGRGVTKGQIRAEGDKLQQGSDRGTRGSDRGSNVIRGGIGKGHGRTEQVFTAI